MKHCVAIVYLGVKSLFDNIYLGVSMVKILASLVFLSASISSVQAANVFTEDFEGYGAVSGFQVVNAGPLGSLSAWTVAGSVDVVNGNYGAILANSIDLNGDNPGSITRSFATIAGATYTLDYQYNSNGPAAPFAITFGTTSSSNLVGSPMGTVLSAPTLSFVGDGSTQTVSFSAIGGQNQGAVIDNVVVNVTPVPEATETAMLLAGLGVIGFMVRRRNAR